MCIRHLREPTCKSCKKEISEEQAQYHEGYCDDCWNKIVRRNRMDGILHGEDGRIRCGCITWIR